MDCTEIRQEYRDETELQTMVSDEVHEPHFTHEYVTWLESKLVKSSLGYVSKCKCNEPTKCYNCDEMVVLVSTGEFCPSCFC